MIDLISSAPLHTRYHASSSTSLSDVRSQTLIHLDSNPDPHSLIPFIARFPSMLGTTLLRFRATGERRIGFGGIGVLGGYQNGVGNVFGLFGLFDSEDFSKFVDVGVGGYFGVAEEFWLLD
ncbi:hypothetical protein Droror1_Dr00000518 [Drosera rotundifolia]